MNYRFSSQAAQVILLTSLALGLPVTNAYVARTTSYTYTDQGQIETVDGPRLDVTDVTTYGYDDKGNRNLVRNALGQETQSTAYDGAGRPLTIIDPNGLTTQLTYDPRGRLLTQSVTDGLETRETGYTYDLVGNLTEVVSQGGHYCATTTIPPTDLSVWKTAQATASTTPSMPWATTWRLASAIPAVPSPNSNARSTTSWGV